jgi:hypothetical protein
MTVTEEEHKAALRLQDLLETQDARDSIPDIIEMMRLHLRSPKVQEYACAALWNLAYDEEKNHALIVEAGGIDSLITAMKTHRRTAVVQVSSLQLLEAFESQNIIFDKNEVLFLMQSY